MNKLPMFQSMQLYSSEFQEIINNVIDLYRAGGASKKKATIIKEKLR